MLILQEKDILMTNLKRTIKIVSNKMNYIEANNKLNDIEIEANTISTKD